MNNQKYLWKLNYIIGQKVKNENPLEEREGCTTHSGVFITDSKDLDKIEKQILVKNKNGDIVVWVDIKKAEYLGEAIEI